MIGFFSRASGILASSRTGGDFLYDVVRTATKKAGGTVKNGRDSPGQRLGVKKFGGERVIPGNIIIRQRGKKFHHGENTGLGRDYTIFALTEGWVKFVYIHKIKRSVVTVVSENPNPPPYIDKSKIATPVANA